jgi:hypothetical protein
MSDSNSGPEVPEVDNDIDVPAAPTGDSESTDTTSESGDNDGVTLNKQDVWKDLEGKTKAGAELAKKTGVEAYAKGVLKDQLVEKAMLIEDDMNVEGTEAYKLNFVWNELTPEGRSEFLKGNSLIWKMLAMAKANTLPMLEMAENTWHFFKRKTYNPENLDIGDFTPAVVQMYCSLGLLECSEEEAKSIDEMAAKGLKVAATGAKVLGWIALAIPTLEPLKPVLDTAGKAAGLAALPAEWAAKLMPEVRAEVKRKSVEVQAERVKQHNAAGQDLGKEVPIAAQGPMDYAKEQMPANASLGEAPKAPVAPANNPVVGESKAA